MKELFRKCKSGFCTLLCSLMLFVLWGDNTVSATSDDTFVVELCGIIDEDGLDRTSWQTTAGSWLSKIDNAEVNKRTAFNTTKLKSYILDADMFVIHTHGSSTTLKAVDSIGITSVLNYDSVASWSNTSLSDLKLAYLAACKVGEGGINADNLVNIFFSKGADCVIGYTTTVYTDANRIMIREFCKAIGAGYTIQNALAYADAKVLSEYGSAGKTNNRLVRGSTATKFRDKSQGLTAMLTNDDMDVMGMVYYKNEENIYGFFDNSKISTTYNVYAENDVSKELISQERVVNDYLEERVDNFSNYKFVSNYYTEDTCLTTYIYEYNIEGYNTLDRLFVMINNKNEIVSCIIPNKDMYKNVDVENIDEAEAIVKLNNILTNRGIESYCVLDKFLVIENEKVAIRYSIDYCVESDTNCIEDFIIELE